MVSTARIHREFREEQQQWHGNYYSCILQIECMCYFAGEAHSCDALCLKENISRRDV